MYRLALLFPFFFLFGCNNRPAQHLDGKRLMEQKCSQCHNLDLPPKTYENEKAPPMMAVAFHLRAFVPAQSASDKVPNAINFIKDYVINPSPSKSFCDKESLKSYGVMPSQNGKVTQGELQAIGEYLFSHFTQKNLNNSQTIQNRLNAMPQGERLVLQNACIGCHRSNKDMIGPSFHKIALRYKGNSRHIANSIENGSKGNWKGYHGVFMPKFNNKLTQQDADTIAEWIMNDKVK